MEEDAFFPRPGQMHVKASAPRPDGPLGDHGAATCAAKPRTPDPMGLSGTLGPMEDNPVLVIESAGYRARAAS